MKNNSEQVHIKMLIDQSLVGMITMNFGFVL